LASYQDGLPARIGHTLYTDTAATSKRIEYRHIQAKTNLTPKNNTLYISGAVLDFWPPYYIRLYFAKHENNKSQKTK